MARTARRPVLRGQQCTAAPTRACSAHPVTNNWRWVCGRRWPAAEKPQAQSQMRALRLAALLALVALCSAAHGDDDMTEATVRPSAVYFTGPPAAGGAGVAPNVAVQGDMLVSLMLSSLQACLAECDKYNHRCSYVHFCHLKVSAGLPAPLRRWWVCASTGPPLGGSTRTAASKSAELLERPACGSAAHEHGAAAREHQAAGLCRLHAPSSPNLGARLPCTHPRGL